MSLLGACLHYAVLPNAVFYCRPRMNVSSKAWLPHPTPNPQWGAGGISICGYTVCAGGGRGASATSPIYMSQGLGAFFPLPPALGMPPAPPCGCGVWDPPPPPVGVGSGI